MKKRQHLSDQDRYAHCMRLFDMLESAAAEENHGNAKKALEELRDALGMTPRDFAERCGVSLSSYYRWVERDIPPVYRREKIQGLINECCGRSAKEVTRNSIFLPDGRRITIRPLEQLLDRYSKAKEIYIFKNSLPFKAGKPSSPRQELLAALDDNADLVVRCMFLGGENPKDARFSRFPAQDSFAEFKRAAFQHNPESAKRLKGFSISEPVSAWNLGIPNSHHAVIVIIYDSGKTKGMTNLEGRNLDMFFEIPIAVYDEVRHTQLTGDGELRWIELEPHPAKNHWDYFLFPAIKAWLKENKGKEFLATQEEAEQYQVHLWQG